MTLKNPEWLRYSLECNAGYIISYMWQGWARIEQKRKRDKKIRIIIIIIIIYNSSIAPNPIKWILALYS